LLIFPRIQLSRSAFQRFVSNIIEADAKRHGTRSSPFALAAFHPDASLDLGNADRLVPFLRRSPDPTIQVVRISALERVRGDEIAGTQYVDLRRFRLEDLPSAERTLRDRIGEHNLQTLHDERAAVTKGIESIHEDHVTTRQWLPSLAGDHGTR
jgi:hypothetical protein